MDLKEKYITLESLDAILELKNNSSSKDGEYSWFEEKGISTKFIKQSKDNLSKEICAFSNTYGGILLCHFGADNTVQKYDNNDIETFHTKLEDWLASSTEPRLSGIDLKIVEGVFLIYVPESKNKPHRATDKVYYYRHVTQSHPMPEIMVSSMYQSQSFLETECNLTLIKENSTLNIVVTIKNNSNISGSMPKIRLAIANESSGSIDFSGDNIQEPSVTQFNDITDYLDEVKFSYIESNGNIQTLLLYPNDILAFNISAFDMDRFASNIFLVLVDYFFKEASKKRYTFLLKVNKEGIGEYLSCPEEQYSKKTLDNFLNLSKEKNNLHKNTY